MNYSTYGSKRRDKTGRRFAMTVVMAFLAAGFAAWTIVEFILYLVKDNPFNGWSLGLFIAAIVLEIYFFIKLALSR